MGFQPLRIGKARGHRPTAGVSPHRARACGLPGAHQRRCKYCRERVNAGMYHNVDYPHGTWTGGKERLGRISKQGDRYLR